MFHVFLDIFTEEMNEASFSKRLWCASGSEVTLSMCFSGQSVCFGHVSMANAAARIDFLLRESLIKPADNENKH